jgi:hypothetical protein
VHPYAVGATKTHTVDTRRSRQRRGDTRRGRSSAAPRSAAGTGGALREVRDGEAGSLTRQGREERRGGGGGTNGVDGLTESGDRPVRAVGRKKRQQKRHALVAISM